MILKTVFEKRFTLVIYNCYLFTQPLLTVVIVLKKAGILKNL